MPRSLSVYQCVWGFGLALLGLSFFSLPFTVTAQSVCPIKTVTVSSLNGRAVDRWKGEAPWTNLMVVLRADDDEQTQLSSTTTDEKGYFRFGSLKKGRYLIDFSTTFLPTYRAVVRLRNSRNANAKPWLLVKLGVDCWESEIEPLK